MPKFKKRAVFEVTPYCWLTKSAALRQAENFPRPRSLHESFSIGGPQYRAWYTVILFIGFQIFAQRMQNVSETCASCKLLQHNFPKSSSTPRAIRE